LNDIANPLSRLHKMRELLHFGLDNPEYMILCHTKCAHGRLDNREGCDWTQRGRRDHPLKDTLSECMEKGFIHRPDVNSVAMASGAWCMDWCRWLYPRPFRQAGAERNMLPTMLQSLSWMEDYRRVRTDPSGTATDHGAG